jgi:hypothetical protein
MTLVQAPDAAGWCGKMRMMMAMFQLLPIYKDTSGTGMRCLMCGQMKKESHMGLVKLHRILRVEMTQRLNGSKLRYC